MRNNNLPNQPEQARPELDPEFNQRASNLTWEQQVWMMNFNREMLARMAALQSLAPSPVLDLLPQALQNGERIREFQALSPLLDQSLFQGRAPEAHDANSDSKCNDKGLGGPN